MPKGNRVTDFNEMWGEDSGSKGMQMLLLLE